MTNDSTANGETGLDLKADGETLWITEQSKQRGFALIENCPAVIIEQNEEGAADKIVEYGSVERAIKSLDTYDTTTKNAQFDGKIYVFFKDGIASSVILTDAITDVEHKNPSGGIKYAAELSVNDAGKVVLTVATANNENVADAEGVAFEYSLVTSSLVGDKSTEVVANGTIAKGQSSKTVTFGTTNPMLAYQATVKIAGETIKTNVLFG